jgi:hypothetical protein
MAVNADHGFCIKLCKHYEPFLFCFLDVGQEVDFLCIKPHLSGCPGGMVVHQGPLKAELQTFTESKPSQN